jgi:hypothetical protein
MSFQGANINKSNGGLGRTSDSDRVVVLVAGMTLPAGLAYYQAKELLDITTAEGLVITAATDNNNGELTHYNLSEMFRLAPESTFWLIPVDKTKTVADLVADASLMAAIRGIAGRNVLGFVGLTTTIANALTDAVKFQSLVTAFAAEKILIDGVIVEGVGGDAQLAITDYPDLRTAAAANVSYVIAQDPAVASLVAGYAKRASIGTALGSIAVRKIHEDIGSVDIETKPRLRRGEENYSLSDSTLGYWLSAALSDGKTFASLTAGEQKSLTAKGWWYVGSFADYPGFYWNGCPTCVSKDSDYRYFNLNCIWNKGARIIRNTLIPRVRSKVPTDPTTGYLKSTWVSGCEASVLSKLDTMVTAGNIEDRDCYINPAQAPDEDTPLSVKGELVVGKIVHEFDVDLGLTDKL